MQSISIHQERTTSRGYRPTPSAERMTAEHEAGATATHGDLLGRYLAEVRRHPVLDAEREKVLAVAYKEQGDKDAARLLVTSNLRLAVKIAFEYQRSWTNVLDLIQEGNMGLSQALDRFDPYRGIRFTSYAQYWIRAFILQYLMNNVSLVRIGSTRSGRKLFYKLQKERRLLASQGINPGTLLLAERLGVSEAEIIRVGARLNGADLSLDSPIAGDEYGRTLQETLVSVDEWSPEQEVAAEEGTLHLKQALDSFAASLVDGRDQQIWAARLTAEDPLSLAELGNQFGVSKERVRQLEERLKGRARTWLSEVLGAEVDE